MTRLGLVDLDFWVGMIAQAVVLTTYSFLMSRTEHKWNVSRAFFSMLAVVVIAWYAIGLTSTNHRTDDTILIFFSAVSVLFIFEAVMIVVLARREWRRRKSIPEHAAPPPADS